MIINLGWLFDEILNKRGYVERGDCKIKIIKSEKYIFVMFPGTGSLKNWFWNFTRLVIPYKRMPKLFFVHAGFFKIYKDVQDFLHRTLQENPKKQIILAGYSQGGAIATIAHEDCEFMGYKPITITFAQPRVFSRCVPKNRFNMLFRFYVKGDIVSKVPFFRFRHVGKAHPIGKGTGIIPSIKKHYPEIYQKFLMSKELKIEIV